MSKHARTRLPKPHILPSTPTPALSCLPHPTLDSTLCCSPPACLLSDAQPPLHAARRLALDGKLHGTAATADCEQGGPSKRQGGVSRPRVRRNRLHTSPPPARPRHPLPPCAPRQRCPSPLVLPACLPTPRPLSHPCEAPHTRTRAAAAVEQRQLHPRLAAHIHQLFLGLVQRPRGGQPAGVLACAARGRGREAGGARRRWGVASARVRRRRRRLGARSGESAASGPAQVERSAVGSDDLNHKPCMLVMHVIPGSTHQSRSSPA